MKENYPPGRTAHGATPLDGSKGIHAVDPRYSHALDLLSKGDKSGAIAELLGLLEESPGSAVAHNDLGCLYQELGDPEAALRHYEKAIEIDPAYTTALKNLAAFLFAIQHRIGDALLLYHRILSAQPDDVETLEALGHISIAIEALDIARRFYRRILKLEPDHAGATAILKMLHDPEARQGSPPACSGEKPHEESQATAPIESGPRSDHEVICCPFCGHVDAERYRTSADIVRCLSCGTVYLRTRLNKNAMRRVYQSYADGPSHMALPADGEAIKKSGLRRDYFLNELLEFTAPVGRLLDVGCGWGAFLDNARDRGFEVQGIEVTRKCVAFANERLGIPVTDEPFEDVAFESGSLSVVTMLHVLEHLPEPSRAIENAYRSLKPGGIFCGIVPNIESLCSRELGETWYWLDPQYHYVHYSPSTLKMHLESAGFTVERLYTATGDYGRENVLQVIQRKQDVAAGRLEALIEQIERDGLGEEIRFFARKPTHAHRPAESPGNHKDSDRGEAATAPLPKGCASIIIPVYNQVEFTSRCLEALYANTPLDRVHEVIVVDNASSDGTAEFLEKARKRYPKLKVLTNPENLLFARACNQGADVAGGDVLVFLNNDTEPLPGWLDRALERLDQDDSIGAVGIKLLFPDGTVQHCGIQFFRNAHPSYTVWPLHRHLHAAADDPRVNIPGDVDAVTGACLFIRNRLFRRIGGFEERYGMYFEDTDLCFKVRRAGNRVFYEPASVVIHHEGKSSPGRDVVHSLKEASARRFFKIWREDLIRFELDTLVEKEEGRYAYMPENFWPEEVNPQAVVRMHALLANFPPCYVHFGGAGDALLLLSTFYDKDPGQTVVSVSNSTAMMRSFFDAFPKLKKVIFIPFPKNYTWHFIARQFFKSSDICQGMGATPTTTADYREWNADLDIFTTYGIRRRPEWAVRFDKCRIEPIQLVIQPRGSLKGMVGSKRNVIPPKDWPRLLSYLAKKGIRPVVIGTPDEAEEYPCLDKALDRRSYSFTEQLRLIAGSDFFVGADSWGKTFAALAGIPTFVFHAVRGDDLKGWKDDSDHVFLDPWEEITVVKDLGDFRRAFDAVRHAGDASGDGLKIRWEGSQFVHHSLALVNRELCLRLIAGGCELSVIPYERDQFSPKEEPRFKPIAERVRGPLSGPVDVHVRHRWPPDFNPPPEGHWVMIQPWEFGSLPREWVRPMSEHVDEIWVPSRYVRDCFIRSGVPAERVTVVPNGVNTDLFKPGNAPYRLSTKKGFKFLFVGGTIQRKGIDILLDAYSRSFSSADDVCLVIKDMGGQSFYKGQTAKEWIRRFQGDPDHPEIEYIERTLSDREIAGLYTACDCLVHPYRGEGFGLPIAEAMASGLPVIVTGHGAALDFCDETTAYLIPAKEVRLREKRVGEFETVDFPWLAEPDRDSLVGLMRHAASHPEEAASKGRLAAEFIRSRFTWDRAAEAVKKRVRELRGKPILRLEQGSESLHRLKPPCGTPETRRCEATAHHESSTVDTGVSISPYRAKAHELYQRGNLRAAAEAYLDAIKATPWDRECYLSMAEMLIETKHYKEARDLLGEEMIGPPDARTLSLLGGTQEGLGNDDEAERLAAQALERTPGFAPALNLQGVIAFKRGDRADAERLFSEAAIADPSWGEPLTNLGVLLWAAGEKEKSLDLLEKGFALSPCAPDLAERYHAAAVAMGLHNRAERAFRDARSRHPQNRTIAFLLIDLLISQGKDEEAMARIEAAMAAFEVDDGFIDAALAVRGKIGPMAIERGNGRPTLSLCMIVRDERANLVRCLSSVKAAVDEMIVVDTGSTDRTRDLAAVFGARVFDFAWTDDFSSARNFSLSKAKGDWILVLDADESLSPRDHGALRSLIRKSPKRIGGYDLATRNYVMEANTAGWTANDGTYPGEEAGTGWYANRKVRLFRNDPRIRFSGAVHELVEASIAAAGMEIAACDVPVHHTGKLDRARVTEKGERYFELGKKKIEETGGTPRAVLELAVQAGELGRWDDAVDLWRRFLGVSPGREVGRAYVNLINACLNADRFYEALAEARKAAALGNGTKELLLNCAAAEFFAGNLRKAVRSTERLLQKNPDYPPALGLSAMVLALTGQEERGLKALRRLSQKGFEARSQLLPAIEKLRTAGRGEQANRLLEFVDRHVPGAADGRGSAPDRLTHRVGAGLPG